MSSVHAIEVTSRCSMSCVYCPHPHALTRPKQDISDEMFEQALRWVDPEQVGEINLSGVGEPLLHPHIVDYVADVRLRFGPSMEIVIPTNGLMLDDDLASQLAPYRPMIHVSLHQPAKAARAVQAALRYGILGSVSCDAVTNPNDVAGQVEWYKSAIRYPCPWVKQQLLFVASTGDILVCCFDLSNESKMAHVSETPRTLQVRPWRCCAACHQDT